MSLRLVFLLPLVLLSAGPPANESVNAQATRPSPEPRTRLDAAAERVGQAVMLLGHPDFDYGVAFIISREHRLLATDARVADLIEQSDSLIAVANGTSTRYRVERIWSHPEALEEPEDPQPAPAAGAPQGRAHARRPSVAVVQLAPGGPDLPAECELASADELVVLAGRPVGVFGFPGYWFYGRPVHAAYRRGTVTRMVDFDLEPEGSWRRRPIVEHTAPTRTGFTGGPVFLENGHIAAIAFGSRYSLDSETRTVQEAIRIDCLWELLVYSKLDSLVAIRAPREVIRVTAGGQADFHRERLRRAVQLVHHSRAFSRLRDYRKAGEYCNEAVRLAPDQALAYVERANVRAEYCDECWNEMAVSDRRQQIDWGLADVEAAARLGALEPNQPWPSRMKLRLYRMILDRDVAGLRRAIETEVDEDHLQAISEGDRAEVMSVRALARETLGDAEGALLDYQESTRRMPYNTRLYLSRAFYWGRHGRPDLAARDRRVAAFLRGRRER